MCDQHQHVYQDFLLFTLLRFYVVLYFHLYFYSFVVVSPGFQAAATTLSLGASIGLWQDFKSRWGLVTPVGPSAVGTHPDGPIRALLEPWLRPLELY